MNNESPKSVLRLSQCDPNQLQSLLERFGLRCQSIARDTDIPGSYWGEPEAGLIGDELIVRNDTPVHSILHEACHYVCMDQDRRSGLHTNAGGDHDEENAVCYLQILLADELPGMGRDRMLSDMDDWGYTFRLGSARAWFQQDAEDARSWLQKRGLIGIDEQPKWRLA
jgi:hypothetical protein